MKKAIKQHRLRPQLDKYLPRCAPDYYVNKKGKVKMRGSDRFYLEEDAIAYSLARFFAWALDKPFGGARIIGTTGIKPQVSRTARRVVLAERLRQLRKELSKAGLHSQYRSLKQVHALLEAELGPDFDIKEAVHGS